MVSPVPRRCPVYEFKPQVSYRNESRLPPALFGIRVPASLAIGGVPCPIYITPQQMLEKLRARPQHSAGRSIGAVHGLTETEFSLRFADFERQWRPVARGSCRAWQFQGGPIFFELNVGLYMLEADRPQAGDRYGRRIFAMIMEHELAHVADEIDIVSHWLPRRAYQVELVQRHLSQARPVDERSFRHWFLEGRFESWLRDGLWLPEHHRRQAERDSPSQYAALQHQIEQLRNCRPGQPVAN